MKEGMGKKPSLKKEKEKDPPLENMVAWFFHLVGGGMPVKLSFTQRFPKDGMTVALRDYFCAPVSCRAAFFLRI